MEVSAFWSFSLQKPLSADTFQKWLSKLVGLVLVDVEGAFQEKLSHMLGGLAAPGHHEAGHEAAVSSEV